MSDYFDIPDDFDDEDDYLNKQGKWTDRDGATHLLKEMSTSYLLNVKSMLKRSLAENPNNQFAKSKIEEVQKELDNRVNTIEQIVKHQYNLSELFLLECAEKLGIPIPESGAGIYFERDNVVTRITNGRLSIRYDVTEPLPTRRNKQPRTGRTTKQATKSKTKRKAKSPKSRKDLSKVKRG